MVIRILLNPKSVDMEGVTTLAQAQAENEQLKQGIEERNRQAIAAWEARTGLKYDPEWREHVLRPDGPVHSPLRMVILWMSIMARTEKPQPTALC